MKRKRKIDILVNSVRKQINKNFILIRKKQIGLWKSVSLIGFFAGLALTVIAIGYINLGNSLRAGEKPKFWIDADNTAVNKDDSFKADVIMNTGGNNVVTAKVIVDYNIQELQLLDIDTAQSIFSVDNSCVADGKFCQIIENNPDNGKITITEAKPTPGVKTDSGVIATLNFKAIKATDAKQPNITIEYSPSGGYSDSDIIVDDGKGTDILNSTAGASIVINPPACTDYTYSDWGNCVYDQDQKGYYQFRTVLTKTPADCGGEPKATDLQKSCSAPVCTDFTYTDWSPAVCPASGKQTREATSQDPIGCQGGNPILTTDCTYTPPTCTYTYSDWSPCPEGGGKQTRTETKSPEGCVGGTKEPTDQQCTIDPPTCQYTYSDWSPAVCPPNGKQTRTETKSPDNCQGGTKEVTERSCTYVTPTCNYTYSDWTPAVCPASRKQTRKETKKTDDCQGGIREVTERTCTYTPPTCTYTYSDWSTCPDGGGKQTRTETRSSEDCQGGKKEPTEQQCTAQTCTHFKYSDWSPSECPANGLQTRTVDSQSPNNCVGGTPVLEQSCNYVPPVVSSNNSDSKDDHKKKDDKKKSSKKDSNKKSDSAKSSNAKSNSEKSSSYVKNSNDKTGPTISIPSYLAKNRGDKIWWTATDASGIDHYTYTFGSRSGEIKSGSIYIAPNMPRGLHLLTIRAYDRAGNVSKKTVLIYVKLF